jgi:hypothetical protein
MRSECEKRTVFGVYLIVALYLVLLLTLMLAWVKCLTTTVSTIKRKCMDYACLLVIRDSHRFPFIEGSSHCWNINRLKFRISFALNEIRNLFSGMAD